MTDVQARTNPPITSVARGLDPIGAKIAKAVCVTVPGLQRIIPLRSMLRSARDTRA